MAQEDVDKILALAQRRVATAAGARLFGQPIGAVIRADVAPGRRMGAVAQGASVQRASAGARSRPAPGGNPADKAAALAALDQVRRVTTNPDEQRAAKKASLDIAAGNTEDAKTDLAYWSTKAAKPLTREILGRALASLNKFAPEKGSSAQSKEFLEGQVKGAFQEINRVVGDTTIRMAARKSQAEFEAGNIAAAKASLEAVAGKGNASFRDVMRRAILAMTSLQGKS